MEAPYARETEEVIGEDLITRRKSSKFQPPIRSISSTSSCITTESSDAGNFEYSESMENQNTTTTNNNNTFTTNNNYTNNYTIFTNGQKPKIIEGRSAVELLSEANEEEEEPNVALNGDTNGFTVHQNGFGVHEYSLPESNGGHKEADVQSDASTFSKSPEASVGLQLLDDSSNGDNVASFEMYNGENIVNKTLVVNGQNEIVETEHSQEVEPEVDEYDVEKVVQNQETHDFFCPNCKSCITKRVILKRRKRKHGDISEDDKVSGKSPGQIDPPIVPGRGPITDDIRPGTGPSPDNGASGSSFDAISCFSCFSIFVPKGDGFLCWRFKTKPAVTLQTGESGDPLAGSIDSAGQQKEDGTETPFPLWILTCCQPYHAEKQVTKPVSKPSLTPENDKQVPPQKGELPLQTPPHDVTVPAGSQPSIVTEPVIPLSRDPGEEFLVTPTPDSPVTPTPDSPVTSDIGKDNFPLWIVTCCQPASEEKKQKSLEKPGLKVPPTEKDRPSPPSQDKPVTLILQQSTTPGHADPVLASKPLTPITPFTGTPLTADKQPLVTPVPPQPESIITAEPDAGTTLIPRPLHNIKPDDNIPSPLDPEAPPTPPKGDVIVPIPDETPVPQPVYALPESGTGPILEIKIPLLYRQPEPPRPGVSGLDIIKAIVYGGLVECITSLTVISSAAGGDATTLNIVALGLANVFGGLILLLHDLRILKHDQSTERYEDQLGRPGHFMLHAVVAVISYLVFGLMSPIIYGFTFRKSDNKDYKLATLATAALVSITILSIGKSYVRRPPKEYIKTILYYITMGFMVSGAGYVAGDLINMLLIKLGVFDSKAPVNGAWSSY
ncbi:uncharacterized protein [Spinacia oleracea]|uniref:Uncharacterized protein isoform X3 n=1 Tax=Spinacia oleracea TaxID=3562 RepID=A0A9R0K531_SPIOL|nr:uncharacterized protein LOC110798001 isoform X3 [Spinacia oleracea]